MTLIEEQAAEIERLEIEITRLRAENAKVCSLLRWNIVEDEEGLIICDGDHEKGEKCDHRRLYWQSIVDALRAENEKLREALKPFADMSKEVSSNWREYETHWLVCVDFKNPPTVAQLRAAAAALQEERTSED